MEEEIRIILIDLRKFNPHQLREMCDKYQFGYFYFKELKEAGATNVWIDLNTLKVLAMMTKGENYVKFLSLGETLMTMQSITPPKKECDVDDILDKINKYGIKSLRKYERDYLNSISKKDK